MSKQYDAHIIEWHSYPFVLLMESVEAIKNAKYITTGVLHRVDDFPVYPKYD